MGAYWDSCFEILSRHKDFCRGTLACLAAAQAAAVVAVDDANKGPAASLQEWPMAPGRKRECCLSQPDFSVHRCSSGCRVRQTWMLELRECQRSSGEMKGSGWLTAVGQETLHTASTELVRVTLSVNLEEIARFAAFGTHVGAVKGIFRWHCRARGRRRRCHIWRCHAGRLV